MGSAGPGGSFEGLAQGDRDASTSGPGSGARRTTYSRWWVPNVAATAGRGRWGTASSQRQIASIDRSRHTSFHSGGTSGQLRVRASCLRVRVPAHQLPGPLGVPQGVRDTSRQGCGGGLTAAATEPRVLPAGAVSRRVHINRSVRIKLARSNGQEAKALGGLLDPGLMLKSRVRVPSRSAFGRHPNFRIP